MNISNHVPRKNPRFWDVWCVFGVLMVLEDSAFWRSQTSEGPDIDSAYQENDKNYMSKNSRSPKPQRSRNLRTHKTPA